MSGPIVFIIGGLVITTIAFFSIYKLAGFGNGLMSLPILQKLLFFFVAFYTPVQLMVMLAAGHNLPMANTRGNEMFSLFFTTTHALMAVMGMVVCAYYYKQNKLAAMPMVFNAVTSVFYFMSALIFLRVL